ncbi:MAG: ornithine cyclodeaminase, partial [Burkholderiales bacterium]|nr:ornithine cyclodeaminase [Burkholderiales bacterium]
EAQVTVFDSVGFALEDFSALCYVERLARELGIGQDVDLVPRAGDPKDLFGLAQGPRAGLRRAA